MEFKAKEIAEILKGTVDGDPEAKVSTFARIENGKPGALCFFANPKYEHYVYDCEECNKDNYVNLTNASLCLLNDSYSEECDRYTSSSYDWLHINLDKIVAFSFIK